MGVSVRGPSLKLRHRFRRKPYLIRFTRVALCLRERLVAKYSHDLVCGGSRIGKTPTSSFAKAMRLTIEREPGTSDWITHPLAEAIDSERLSACNRLVSWYSSTRT